VARPEEDEATFEVKTEISARSLAERLVLDAGCGGARYARLLGNYKSRVVGIDLSAAVIKAATLCTRFPNIFILQADLLELPLPESSFDLVYSIRVLHHTPDRRTAFREVAGRVKPGGYLAVWLYRRNTFVQERLNSWLLIVTTRLSG
jgi:SAM-dependent methyltransferase